MSAGHDRRDDLLGVHERCQSCAGIGGHVLPCPEWDKRLRDQATQVATVLDRDLMRAVLTLALHTEHGSLTVEWPDSGQFEIGDRVGLTIERLPAADATYARSKLPRPR